ncbi:hypothetical protein ONZ45_g16612 [Pleurotus djamor]|nr:hypothetical protein ONZ45_g16612 [Pleurotus djamor]
MPSLSVKFALLFTLSLFAGARADCDDPARPTQKCCMNVAQWSTNSYVWGTICGYTPADSSEYIGGRCITITSGSCPSGTVATCCGGSWPGPSGRKIFPALYGSSQCHEPSGALDKPTQAKWNCGIEQDEKVRKGKYRTTYPLFITRCIVASDHISIAYTVAYAISLVIGLPVTIAALSVCAIAFSRGTFEGGQATNPPSDGHDQQSPSFQLRSGHLFDFGPSPWRKYSEDPERYFYPECLPANIHLDDPSRMSVRDVRRFYRFLLRRQEAGKIPMKCHTIRKDELWEDLRVNPRGKSFKGKSRETASLGDGQDKEAPKQGGDDDEDSSDDIPIDWDATDSDEEEDEEQASDEDYPMGEEGPNGDSQDDEDGAAMDVDEEEVDIIRMQDMAPAWVSVNQRLTFLKFLCAEKSYQQLINTFFDLNETPNSSNVPPRGPSWGRWSFAKTHLPPSFYVESPDVSEDRDSYPAFLKYLSLNPHLNLAGRLRPPSQTSEIVLAIGLALRDLAKVCFFANDAESAAGLTFAMRQSNWTLANYEELPAACEQMVAAALKSRSLRSVIPILGLKSVAHHDYLVRILWQGLRRQLPPRALLIYRFPPPPAPSVLPKLAIGKANFPPDLLTLSLHCGVLFTDMQTFSCVGIDWKGLLQSWAALEKALEMRDGKQAGDGVPHTVHGLPVAVSRWVEGTLKLSRILRITAIPISHQDPSDAVTNIPEINIPIDSELGIGNDDELSASAHDPYYEGDEYNQDNTVDPALVRRRYKEAPLIGWMSKRDIYLAEVLRLEGREGCYNRCINCDEDGVFTCPDCFGDPILTKWNDDFFETVSLASLGLSIQLGHPLGESCPNPARSFNGSFAVITLTGIVNATLYFCDCVEAVPRAQQLLRFRLFPATHTEPRTAATFEVLNHFQLLSFNSKVSAYEFYQTLVRLTDNVGNAIPNRYGIWLFLIRQWRHIRQMKRFGRGHSESGIEGTEEGECAVLCPVCPHDGKNLPENWQAETPARQWLYTLFLAIDANFRLKRLDVSTDKKDPPLNKGAGYFVEDSKYKEFLAKFGSLNVEDENTCHEYDAVKQANIRGGKGTAASGVGTIECSCHDMKRPLSVGDLQKGERYINMDYLYFSSIRNHAPMTLCVSYDIACQWNKKLVARSEQYGPEVVGDTFSQRCITYLVPKFHLFAHRSACHVEYSFNLTPRVGRTDGESPERGWAAMNPIASSTKEMGPGSRRDTLDDHFGDYNWRKVISFHSSLLTKFEEALVMRSAHATAFLEFSASLPTASVEGFTKAVRTWERDPTKMNPYRPTIAETTQAKIRLQLATEDAAAIAQDQELVRHDITPRALISQGLEIEEQQSRLAIDSAKLGSYSTEIQQSQILERRNRLCRRITSWRLVQQLYIPAVTALILEEGDSGEIDAENLNLFLPSALLSHSSSQELTTLFLQLADYEWRLRYAQALDLLGELRRQLLLLSTMYQSKHRYSHGQHHNTRSASLLANVQARVNAAKSRYRICRGALVALNGPLQKAGWESILRELNDDDVRSLRQGQDMSSLASEGVRQAEGSRTLSWIWSTQRPTTEMTADMSEGTASSCCSIFIIYHPRQLFVSNGASPEPEPIAGMKKAFFFMKKCVVSYNFMNMRRLCGIIVHRDVLRALGHMPYGREAFDADSPQNVGPVGRWPTSGW